MARRERGKRLEKQVLELTLELLQNCDIEVLPSSINDGDTQLWLATGELRGYCRKELPRRVEVLDAAGEEECGPETTALLKTLRELGCNGRLASASMPDKDTNWSSSDPICRTLCMFFLPSLQNLEDGLPGTLLKASLHSVCSR